MGRKRALSASIDYTIRNWIRRWNQRGRCCKLFVLFSTVNLSFIVFYFARTFYEIIAHSKPRGGSTNSQDAMQAALAIAESARSYNTRFYNAAFLSYSFSTATTITTSTSTTTATTSTTTATSSTTMTKDQVYPKTIHACNGASQHNPFHEKKLERPCRMYKCLEAGRIGWHPSLGPGRNNRLYEVKNVQVDKGEWWLTDDLSPFSDCWDQCNPTLGWDLDCPEGVCPGRGGSPRVNLLSDSHRPNFTCVKYNQSAVAEGFFTPNYVQNNMWHHTIDNVFTTFMTLVHLGQYLGRSADSFEMVSLYNRPQDQPRWEIWKSMLPTMKMFEDLHGCYESVVFGFMFYQRPIFWLPSKPIQYWLRDPVMMSWISAFSWNLRRTWNAKVEVQHTAKPVLLFVFGKRVPSFIWDYPWKNMTYHEHWEIQQMDMAPLPFSKQAAIAMSCKGVIGVAGAGFIWQLWMPPDSALLVISNPTPDGRFFCNALPETWHETLGLHLGHTSIVWRFCEGAEAFNMSKPSSVIEFLLQLREEDAASGEARICGILQDYKTAPVWPWCDVYVRLSLPCHPLPTWLPFGQVGIPFDHNSSWELLTPSTAPSDEASLELKWSVEPVPGVPHGRLLRSAKPEMNVDFYIEQQGSDASMSGSEFWSLRIGKDQSSRRLHADHDGRGLLHFGTGDDIAYRWLLENAGGSWMHLRSALHPKQILRACLDGKPCLQR